MGIGCSLAFVSLIASVFCRLFMKSRSKIISSPELVIYAHFGSFFVPFFYSIFTNVIEWKLLLHLKNSSYVAWFTIVLMFIILAPMQVRLVRLLGPSVYSSLSGFRVLGSIFFSF